MLAPPEEQPKGGLATQFSEGLNNVSETISDAYTSAREGLSNASGYIQDSISQFSNKEAVGTETPGFLQSNTMLAKFAFLVMVLIVFLFLVNLGILLIGYFTKPSDNPMLISGTMNAANEVVIVQDPNNANSIPILRSNNQTTGIEFTWSLWIFINDIAPPTSPQFSNIFNKGNGTYGSNGLATVKNGPGLYLDNSGQQLLVAMNTVSSQNPTEYMYVKDIPLRKWFHCAIRLENTLLDVYINGTIAGRIIMQDVPKQNYADVNVCKNGGFNGNIADLKYYGRALSVFELNNVVIWGRNTNAANASSANDATGFPYYLSNLWYNSNY